MENVQPYQILVPMGIVFFIGIMLLIWGDRPELAAWIRSWFDDRPARPVIMSSDEEEDEIIVVYDLENVSGAERTNEHSQASSSPFYSENIEGTAGAEFLLTSEELIAVQAMLRYRESATIRGDKPTKSNSITAGFGLKRGGGPRYTRASEIYDALFGDPEPAVKYPPIAPEQQATTDAIHAR